MRTKISLIILLLAAMQSIKAQLPYSTVQYAVREETGIPFDSALNYCNRLQVIKMNIYKPIGDLNRERPVIIFVHGGAFVSSSNENDADMVNMAKEFASRGYVAASIHYREGLHLFNYPQGQPYVTNAGILLTWAGYFDRNGPDRLYTVDSGEVIRAAYRAQQDLKAAIRFLKERTITDSSVACKFFIGGHSAGAITVLAAAYADDPLEKPVVTNLMSTVPNPQWLSSSSYPFFPCGGQDDIAYRAQNPYPFNFNAPECYVRPDLNDIDGAGNLNGQNLQLLGIASMAGAIIDTNIIAGPRKPAIFLSQQPNDLVVPFNSARPFNYASDYIQPAPNEKWPIVYGSNFIYSKLQRMNYPAAYKLQTFDNGGDITTTHSILPSIAVVADSIARFFARVMDTSTACPLITLPVATSFQATRQGDRSLLSWEIYYLGALRNIELQRSADGRNWITINAQQVSSEGSFSYYDNLPLPLNYYRLKETNTDGRFAYSEVRVISFLSLAASSVYPNPATEFISLQPVFDGAEKAVAIRLYTMQGQLVYSGTATNAGSVARITTSGLANGIYACKLMHASRVETIQVTVAK